MKHREELGLITTFLLVLSLCLPIAVSVPSAIAQTLSPTPVSTPTVISISPNSGLQGQNLPAVVITGMNFTGARSLNFGSEINVNGFIINNDTQITAKIIIAPHAKVGSRDVSVTTPAGTGTLPGSFTVMQAPPTITKLSPNSGFRGQTLLVNIHGNHFLGATAVNFGAGITVELFGAFTETSILTRITIDNNATPGLRDVSVTTPAGTGTLPGGFNVSEAALSIKVTSPNGGENWKIGTHQKIKWTSIGLTGPARGISIHLSRDGGATWNPITFSTKDDGADSWKVTGPPTNQAMIKVVSLFNPDVFDISDAPFIIPAPTIKISSPNGGETLKIGTKKTITWKTSSDLAGRVRIDLSTDGGATWKTIIPSTKDDGSEAWKVTGPPTNQARIKVMSHLNPGVYDISDANFTIAAPTIRVISPNGGENWEQGTSKTITWTSTDLVDNVRIDLSRDGGITWRALKGSTSNDGSFSWKVSGPATNQARIRVLSKSYPTISDVSDANFTINFAHSRK